MGWVLLFVGFLLVVLLALGLCRAASSSDEFDDEIESDHDRAVYAAWVRQRFHPHDEVGCVGAEVVEQVGDALQGELPLLAGLRPSPQPLPRGEQRGVEVKRTNLPKANFLLYLGGAAPLFLFLAGCQSTATEPVEPRLMTGAPVMPICLAFCQIHENLTASEGINAPVAQSVSGQLTGGTSSSTQSKGAP